MNANQNFSIKPSEYRIRELLGWLGILLPYILVLANAIALNITNTQGEALLPSISHYHYSFAGLIFTGVLMAFALLLISYKGYKDSSTWFTDNNITNLAGAFAMVVVLVPTTWESGLLTTPNKHVDDTLGLIHLGAAGLFLALLGALSFFKFTKSDKTDKYHLRRKFLYRFCGLMVWLCI